MRRKQMRVMISIAVFFFSFGGCSKKGVGIKTEGNKIKGEQAKLETETAKVLLELPEIQVVSKDITIPYEKALFVPASDFNNQETKNESANPFELLVKETEAIVYVPTGQTIILMFQEGETPERISISDRIIRQDGANQLSEKVSEEQELTVKSHQVQYTIPALISTALLSTIPENNKLLRGLNVRCQWEDGNVGEYAIVIQTDFSYPTQAGDEAETVQ